MKVEIIPAFNDNYIFFFSCPKTGINACIDPGSFERVDDFLQKNKIDKLDYILNTHHHADHIGGNKKLIDKYSSTIIANEAENKIPNVSIRIKEGDKISIGEVEFSMISLPGHTLNHIAYYCSKENIIFCGDVLFSSGCGRIFEGTYQQAYDSLEKIKKLPLNTKIYCAHEYTMSNIEFALNIEPNNENLILKKKESLEKRANNLPTIPTTLENELQTNPFLRTLEPELRKNIGKNNDYYNVEIFKKLRKMKDSF